MNDVVTLIARVYRNDDFGVQQVVEERRREVMCDVQSANRAEFFAGMQAGLSPEYMMHIHPIEYHGETVAEYNGRQYAVYRTYKKSADCLELYLQQEVGVQDDLCGDQCAD